MRARGGDGQLRDVSRFSGALGRWSSTPATAASDADAMERRHLQQATNGGASSRNLAPPAPSISGGRKPSRPTTSTPSRKQRQSFVAPLPGPTAPHGGGLHQPSTGGGQHPLPGGAPGGFLPWQGLSRRSLKHLPGLRRRS